MPRRLQADFSNTIVLKSLVNLTAGIYLEASAEISLPENNFCYPGIGISEKTFLEGLKDCQDSLREPVPIIH